MAGEAQRRRIRSLLQLAGIDDEDVSPLQAAFVHESAAREQHLASNERLEFLGDALLGAIVAAWLYETYADEPEGMLTTRKASLVNDAALAQTAVRLGFPQILELGVGMRAADGAHNRSILADAFEAFIAALWLRYGLARARKFVETQHIGYVQQSETPVLDAKTRLQHVAQDRFAATPVYRDEERGTPQSPAFASEVSVNGTRLGTGLGPSKKIARRSAAENALDQLQSELA